MSAGRACLCTTYPRMTEDKSPGGEVTYASEMETQVKLEPATDRLLPKPKRDLMWHTPPSRYVAFG
jgi:hypothetical protein